MNYKSIDLAIAFCLMFVVTLFYSGTAAAATNDTITTVLCNAITLITGNLGKAVATIAVIVLGFGLFTGKISWPVAAMTAVGIGLLFGAASIVNTLATSTGGSGALNCS